MGLDLDGLRRRVRPWLSGAVLLGVVAGCEEAEIRTYEAPKDPPQQRLAEAATAETPRGEGEPAMTQPGAQSATELTWTAPDGWQRSEETPPMRLATYYASGPEGDEAALEVAVSAFPGDVGGALANINRWREQLGRGPLSEQQWQEHVEPFGDPDAVHGWTMRIDAAAEAAAAGPDGMLAAIIRSPGLDRTWFVRAFGEAEQLDAHADAVTAFVHTFEPSADASHDPNHAHDHDHDHDHDHPHHHDHAHGHSPGHGHERSAAELELTTPADWRRVEQSSAIVYAAYEIGDAEQHAAVVVTPLHGDGGGRLANVNMWRSQLGLAPVSSEDEQPTDTLQLQGGRTATLIALDGEQDMSLIVAIVPEDERTWFFRLSGSRQAVQAQREAFERFVTTADFEGD